MLLIDKDGISNCRKEVLCVFTIYFIEWNLLRSNKYYLYYHLLRNINIYFYLNFLMSQKFDAFLWKFTNFGIKIVWKDLVFAQNIHGYFFLSILLVLSLYQIPQILFSYIHKTRESDLLNQFIRKNIHFQIIINMKEKMKIKINFLFRWGLIINLHRFLFLFVVVGRPLDLLCGFQLYTLVFLYCLVRLPFFLCSFA